MVQEKTQRVEYLARKMLDGARVLYEFFEELKNAEVYAYKKGIIGFGSRLNFSYAITMAKLSNKTGINFRKVRDFLTKANNFRKFGEL